jgi:hypothetical protein
MPFEKFIEENWGDLMALVEKTHGIPIRECASDRDILYIKFWMEKAEEFYESKLKQSGHSVYHVDMLEKEKEFLEQKIKELEEDKITGGRPMTIEAFIKENWEEFKDGWGISYEKTNHFYLESFKFWIEKANYSNANLKKHNLEWQSAETAPRDGSWFFASWKETADKIFQLQAVQYDDEEEGYSDAVGGTYEFTHWLPLSALPPIPGEKKKIKFELGKIYKANGNSKAVLATIEQSTFSDDTTFLFVILGGGYDWVRTDANGEYEGSKIISEWTEADEAEWVKNNEVENA